MPRDKLKKMSHTSLSRKEAIDRAIAMAEAALRECDEHGLIYAAIDLSSALDKLQAHRDGSDS